MTSHEIRHLRTWTSCIFSFVHDSTAKTQNHTVLDLHSEVFTFPLLEDFVDSNRDRMLLCPVLVVMHYLSGTEHYHPD